MILSGQAENMSSETNQNLPMVPVVVDMYLLVVVLQKVTPCQSDPPATQLLFTSGPDTLCALWLQYSGSWPGKLQLQDTNCPICLL
jgi:hypothetical protein